MPKHPEGFKSIFFDILCLSDLESFLKSWAGEKIYKRGLNYFQKNKVKDLALARDGKVLATVKGSRNYVCSIYLDEGNNLAGDCSCPYDETCKHIVALCLKTRDALNSQETLPICDDLDSREENSRLFLTERLLR